MLFRRKPVPAPASPIKKFEDDIATACNAAMDGRETNWILLIGMADALADAEQRIRVLLTRRPVV
ncbi:MAG TPA: hypothetical protein VH558_02245 [Pseudolabrys sp.]|jgi:hypothetical protein